jgi:hypothetical protein
VWENRGKNKLGLDREAFTRVNWVRPALRIAPDGFALRETVAEYTQQLDVAASELARLGIDKPEEMPNDLPVSLFGGGTLVFDEYGRLKFHVCNRIGNATKQTERLQWLWVHGHFDRGRSRRLHLATLHRQRATSLRTADQRW